MKLVGKLRERFRAFLKKDRRPRGKPKPQATPFDLMVNRLTNWQRTQWAKAGYPGLRKKEPEPVEKFTKLKRV